MDRDELLAFMEARKASEAREGLVCFGCAHSVAGDPPPGRPSGERPCASCVRNPEREKWAATHRKGQGPNGDAIVVDDQGTARCFDPFEGTMYNGAPRIRFPMDNYVTLDQRAQEDWLAAHPEYLQAISFRGGQPVVVKP